jgi:hypothetical protein
MEVKVRWTNQKEVEGRIKMNMDRLGQSVREAMREAAHDLADEIHQRGVDDIEHAGNFGEEWTKAFHADVSETQRTITVEVSMQPEGEPVIYWPVFEHGASIFAKNPSGLMTWPNKSGFSVGGEVPAFISKASVTIPKKFHLEEIVREEAAKAGAIFKKHLAEMTKA